MEESTETYREKMRRYNEVATSYCDELNKENEKKQDRRDFIKYILIPQIEIIICISAIVISAIALCLH